MELDLPAPAFTLQNQHGESISLSHFAGKQHVVIVFYPFAFSGVCTRELGELRDFSVDVTSVGAVILAVSCDPMYSLRVFADREGLDFSLLSDFWPHGEVSAS
ncbi:MAG TPA: redoxin domain-containing protein, partial [Pseudonocardiaceae bacterium]|nr:redoxin domain-containing protein [Pseudonocardiaceae bacterium]